MKFVTLPDIPRIYTALAEWLACMLMISQVPSSQRRRNVFFYAFGAGIIQILLQFWAGSFSLSFWLVGMALNVLWMYLTICLETTPITTRIYHTCKAFIFAEFIAALSWEAFSLLAVIGKFTTHTLIPQFFMAICYALLIFGMYKLQQIERIHYGLLNIEKKSALISLLLMIILFLMSNVSFLWTTKNPLIGNSTTVFTIRTFVDLCGLLIFTLLENQRFEQYLAKDLDNMNNMFKLQYEEYQAYRESSDMVNRRFHDLKQQLDVIALESDEKKRLSYINSLRDDIKQYKADVKTGNPIADVVLTRKNAYCIDNDIQLTCIANGNLLKGIETMDLCSLLGNSLDNAIEAVLKIPDKHKRLIDIRITQRGDMVIFRIKNYTRNNSPISKHELPKTTKKDKSAHGYGLRSIAIISQKYNGTMTIKKQDHWFALQVLFPANIAK
ncbi:ATP-binding protein [Lactobacillus corticis]|uniref:Sensor histidine kinase n=1 Tax=Lactobacillus corticis TaxID=2201249 RepID=A0A916QJ16_9LACO|nr:ATP-binding protein [Lactobacillus corticis]GFZ27097.1 sensor histidine kinase [Lactobacillus corticis]